MATTSGESDQLYIPALPDDIAIEVLARMPPRSHALLTRVCHNWRDLVRSSALYVHRKKSSITVPFLCLHQAAPQLNPKQHPVYSVSLLNEHRNWERLPPIPEYHHWGLPLFCRFAAARGKLLVVGGWNPATWATLRSVHIFNFTSWTWERGANMRSTRSFFACAAVGDCVYVVGGHDNTKMALATAERYDLVSDSWEILPNMNQPRDECTGVALGGKLYAISGYHTATQCKYVESAEVFDPVTCSWAQIDGMIDVSPNVIVSACGGLYAIHEREILQYCSEVNKWNAFDVLPEPISPPLCISSFGRNLVVTGTYSDDEEKCRSFLYELPEGSKRKGVWDALPVDAQFQALTPSSEESLLAWSDVPGAVEDISLEMCKVFWNPIDSCRFVIFFKSL